MSVVRLKETLDSSIFASNGEECNSQKNPNLPLMLLGQGYFSKYLSEMGKVVHIYLPRRI